MNLSYMSDCQILNLYFGAGRYKAPHAPVGTPRRQRKAQPGVRTATRLEARTALAQRIAYERQTPEFQDDKYLNSYARTYGVYSSDMVAQ